MVKRNIPPWEGWQLPVTISGDFNQLVTETFASGLIPSAKERLPALSKFRNTLTFLLKITVLDWDK